jgi:hypothetical protein
MPITISKIVVTLTCMAAGLLASSEPLFAQDFFESNIPPTISDRAEIVSVARRFDLKDLKPLDLGVIGKVGPAIVFLGSKETIPDSTRLYWAMVRVLSERYGCFMTEKRDTGHIISFTCRDKRRVVFNHGSNDELIYFSARQYNRQGEELHVKNHIILAND